MKGLFFLSLSFILLTNSLFAQEREFTMKEGDTSYTMKRYYLCIYLSGTIRNQDSLTLVELQKGHMSHINLMSEKGLICIAGPFGDDTEKRGILLFDVETMEEAEAWIKKDPMVIAGRLNYEIHPWWGAKGSILK